jgi:solute carrier family 34 (sodium-dependent phosphate cotransporter)
VAISLGVPPPASFALAGGEGQVRTISGRGVSWTVLAILGSLYLFLVGISGMGEAFKLFGSDFAARVLSLTSNPFTGLFLGILATALLQSSSTSTSIVVGMVAGGVISLPGAVPIIMGAKIGTTITAFLVSLVYLRRPLEFERAFGAALLHLMFNVVAVGLIFPLELSTGLITLLAERASGLFAQMGGMHVSNPLKAATEPAVRLLRFLLFDQAVALLVVTVVFTFAALIAIVKLLRSVVLDRLGHFFDRHLFRNWRRAMGFGFLLTVVVQSSSIPTSLAIPLAAAGILTLIQIYPFNLGTNVGTTITAILASLATGNRTAITVAFAHLLFNLLAIPLIWGLPFLRMIPLRMATWLAKRSTSSHWLPLALLLGIYFLVPLAVCLFLL